MKLLLPLCLFLMVLGWGRGELQPPERPYKILMVLPVGSVSHRNVFIPLAKGLADRGHKIEIISNTGKILEYPGIREVLTNLSDLDTTKIDMFATRTKAAGSLVIFKEMLPRIARQLYQIPEVKELYARRKEFDLVIINHMFNEVAYPFAYEMPFITITTIGMDYRQSAILGNVLNPAYAPNCFNSMKVSGLIGRLRNTFGHLFTAFNWRLWDIVPAIQEEISAQFPSLPPLLEIEKNQSLSLINSHFSMDMSYPLLPSQIEIGGMHCRPGMPLPEEIQSWIEGAGSNGVVYFSLGSVVRGDKMPIKYRDMFVEAFKRLNQRILWKFEKDIEGLSKNVMIKKWLPQQDILAHPNVKLFITHGGLLSLQESCYHGKPILALPIYSDQDRNARKAMTSGFGLSLVWEEMTVDMIVESIQELVNNRKYSESTAAVSRAMKDQLNPPLESAIFWTEYVIRHKGAPRLRSPAASLTWAEFLLLDVLVLFFLIVFTGLFVIRWTIKKILKAAFSKNKQKKKKKTH